MTVDAPGVAEDLAAAALALARRFASGSTMWCTSPRWPAHGRHVAVEFVHPVIVGKRALPAVHVDCGDVIGATRLLARPDDVLLAVGPADDALVGSLLRRSQAWGLTSLWLGAGPRPPVGMADHVIWIDESDADVAARSGEVVLLYHLLWELTHVVFEHPGLLEADPLCADPLCADPLCTDPLCTDEVCITCSDEGRMAEIAVVHEGGSAEVLAAGMLETVDISLIDPVSPGDLVLVHAGGRAHRVAGAWIMSSEPTGFLYPFIDGDERDAHALLVDLTASARSKIAESRELRAVTLGRSADTLRVAGEAMAHRFRHGGRLFTFGNGGSATDAEGTAEMFRSPPSGRSLPAMSLVDDRAVITALANDVGFELVFARQIIAHARPGDIAMGFSTSGDSVNVLRALSEASRRRLLTIGLSGYEGGAMANADVVDACLVVPSDSVHRIQETQDALVLELWSVVQRCLDEGGEP